MRWNKCAVCGAEYNKADPSARPPTCSEKCFKFWSGIFVDHRGASCWIPGCLEVYCGTRTPGYCCGCDVFMASKEIEKRGLDRSSPFENY